MFFVSDRWFTITKSTLFTKCMCAAYLDKFNIYVSSAYSSNYWEKLHLQGVPKNGQTVFFGSQREETKLTLQMIVCSLHHTMDIYIHFQNNVRWQSFIPRGPDRLLAAASLDALWRIQTPEILEVCWAEHSPLLGSYSFIGAKV